MQNFTSIELPKEMNEIRKRIIEILKDYPDYYVLLIKKGTSIQSLYYTNPERVLCIEYIEEIEKRIKRDEKK